MDPITILPIAEAGRALADCWNAGMLAAHLAPSLTCDEYSYLRELLVACGHDVIGWDRCHAGGDSEEDDCMHEQFLALKDAVGKR